MNSQDMVDARKVFQVAHRRKTARTEIYERAEGKDPVLTHSGYGLVSPFEIAERFPYAWGVETCIEGSTLVYQIITGS